MKTTLGILLLFAIQHFTVAQNSFEIKGRILDASTQKPIPYATVYIDGTTKGTISNRDGQFDLSYVSGSVLIVISHVSYYPKTIELNNQYPSELTISLQERSMEISPVMIEDKNLRDRNLELFKSMFIGRDYWGKNAKLLNDSILSFVTHYASHKKTFNKEVKNEVETGSIKDIVEWADDSTYIVVQELARLEVFAKAPLEIDMPLLGYKLQVDLINFSMDIDNGYVQVNFLGHYYFHAFDLKKKSETNKIERNRRLAYFNSSKHFFRSLHEKKLDENGYLVQESSTEDAPNSIENENTILINHANYIGNDILQLTGLKGKSFTISYYQDYRNEPLDSRKRHRPVFENPYKIEKSKMSFLKDTCVINKTGNVLNNEIMFGGSISQKRVGSYLPENYVLEK